MSSLTQDPSAPSPDTADASSSSRPTRPVAPGSRLFTQGQTPSPLPQGQFRPSDLLSEEDYKRIRLATVTRALAGGLIGGGAAAMAVRQFAPKRPAANTLVAIGLSAGVITQVLVAVTYLKSEIDPIRRRAMEMSKPVTADGSPIFTDAASVNDTAYAFPQNVTRQPLESTGNVVAPPSDEGQWGRLRDGSASEGELRDTFFRPGVPRRDV